VLRSGEDESRQRDLLLLKKEQSREWKAVLSAVAWQEGVLVSRHANRECSSCTAMLTVRGITGRSIKKSAKNELPSYAMRRYSRTHHPRRTVPFASYLCH